MGAVKKPAPATPNAATQWAPARDRVYDYVRDGILRGALAGGTFLEEEQVSLAVGVSRTPVREAFQQLHGDRLIDLLPRRGAMVRAVTVQELLEVYETRLMIESHAAQTLCREKRAPPPAMVDALAKMRRQARASTYAQVQLNTVFHEALVTAAGNAVITDLYRSLESRQERVAMASLHIDPGRQRVIMDEHEQLVAAIAGADAAAAVAVLATHLRPIREIMARLPGFVGPPS